LGGAALPLNTSVREHAETIFTAIIAGRAMPHMNLPQPSEIPALAEKAINYAKLFAEAAKNSPRG
jgi:hypothetical protein